MFSRVKYLDILKKFSWARQQTSKRLRLVESSQVPSQVKKVTEESGGFRWSGDRLASRTARMRPLAQQEAFLVGVRGIMPCSTSRGSAVACAGGAGAGARLVAAARAGPDARVRVCARVAEVVGHREVRVATQLRRRTHVQRAQVAALLCSTHTRRETYSTYCTYCTTHARLIDVHELEVLFKFKWAERTQSLAGQRGRLSACAIHDGLVDASAQRDLRRGGRRVRLVARRSQIH